MSGDRYITIAQLSSILKLGSIPSTHRESYVKELCASSKTVKHILFVSTLNFNLPTQDSFLDYETNTLNVSNILVGLLDGNEERLTGSGLLVKSILNNPDSIGVTAKTLRGLLPSSEDAIDSLVWLLGSRTPVQRDSRQVLVCGCCHRKMKSVTIGEGVCSACKKILIDYSNNRTEDFTIQLNHFNIPHYQGGDIGDINYHDITTGWSFSVSNNIIQATAGQPLRPIQYTLPFMECQKPIIV